MKLRTIKTIAILIITSTSLSAQSKDFNNVITLKNGITLNDVKIEESYTVTGADGKSTVYKKDEVTSIKKKEAPPAGSENWSTNLGYMNWEDAKLKCASKKMRLPTLDELKTAQNNKLTDSWKKEGYLYWSTTQTTNLLKDPYLLYAFNGEIYSLSRFSSSYVRCIK